MRESRCAIVIDRMKLNKTKADRDMLSLKRRELAVNVALVVDIFRPSNFPLHLCNPHSCTFLLTLLEECR